MQDNLVIVESPAKAKTIEKFLGKDFKVVSSYGHVRDLAKKNLGIDIDERFKPHYEITPDKKKVVTQLRKEVKAAEKVWLASDEDREGEAIAWHLSDVLKLKKQQTRRIVFHEITQTAIKNAIAQPRGIDYNLVHAQQARRILDRLVGFEISPVLWKKVKPSLSAGRVQSVAVRLLVEREREIIAFKPKSWYKVSASFHIPKQDGKQAELKAELSKKFKTEKEVLDFLKTCQQSTFTIQSITKKPATKSPAPPFTTSTLQQEAGRKLGFSVSQTMSVAQQLYESGLITYMRTDSVNLSKEAIAAAKKQIISLHGEKYSSPRNFQTKSSSAQEAHEAIRPSYIQKSKAGTSYQQQALYDLIWKRTLASQMSKAELEKTTVTVNVSGSEHKFEAQGEVIKFDGFLKVYLESSDDEDDKDPTTSKLLPPVKEGQELEPKQIDARQRFSNHPPRYNEATLVRKLEELGIGRPSTYAPTISTVQQRGYVVKETREGKERKYKLHQLISGQIKSATKQENYGREKMKLFPTNIGMVVTDFLLDHFQDIFEYDFTARVEKQFDEIANGEMDWDQMLERFYQSFHPQVEETLEKADRNSGERVLGKDPETGKTVIARIGRYGPIAQLGSQEDEDKKFASLRPGQLLETIQLDEALELLRHSNEGRYLGDDPKTGKPIFVRFGKYGPLAQLGSSDDDEKPRYAGLMKGQDLDTITYEEAVDLFKLPRSLGTFENKEVVAGNGRFGPFVKHDNKYVSLKKGDDPFTVDIDRAIELIKAKREKDEKRLIKAFDKSKIKVVNDRWGKPAVQYGRKFVRIPTDTDPKSLSLEDAKQLLEQGKSKKGSNKK